MTDFQQMVQELGPWHQHIVFPDGTEVGHHPAREIASWFLDQVDCEGKTLLDIGCNAGIMCVEAAERGCLVTGFDASDKLIDQAWLVREAFAQDICLMKRDLYYVWKDIEQVEPYSFVLFCGVYYHLWHPMVGLDVAWRCCKEAMLVEGAVLTNDHSCLQHEVPLDEPLAMFIRGTCANDPTNWWYPTERCMEDMLWSLGNVQSIEMGTIPQIGPKRRMWIVRRIPGTWTSESAERTYA